MNTESSTSRRRARLWRAAALCTAIAAAVAEAQSGAPVRATDKVVIVFPTECDVPRKITVVLNGDETARFVATRKEDSEVWTGYWLGRLHHKRFDAQVATASLRLHGARTDCQPSVAAKDREQDDAWVATFTFRCNSEPARQVDIRTDPRDFPVSYVRTLPKLSNDPISVPCRESAIYVGVPVPDVRFNDETLRLQLGLNKPVPDGLGLRVNDILKAAREAKKGEPKPLTAGGVVHALAVQRAAGDSSAPDTSPIAMDIDELNVDRLTTLSLTVK